MINLVYVALSIIVLLILLFVLIYAAVDERKQDKSPVGFVIASIVVFIIIMLGFLDFVKIIYQYFSK
jgi:hypothetical protein